MKKERMVQVAFRVPASMKDAIESASRRILATPSQWARVAFAMAIKRAGRK